ncbi:MAG: hypothetical protein FWG14_09060 [Peptococcaceae bacterium]|nr:hypothetical protein [Peptococcaceae bacterium]
MDATLILSIQKENGTSYEKTLQVHIPACHLPLYQPGKKHQVWYERSDPTKVMIIHPGHPRSAEHTVARIDFDELDQSMKDKKS